MSNNTYYIVYTSIGTEYRLSIFDRMEYAESFYRILEVTEIKGLSLFLLTIKTTEPTLIHQIFATHSLSELIERHGGDEDRN